MIDLRVMFPNHSRSVLEKAAQEFDSLPDAADYLLDAPEDGLLPTTKIVDPSQTEKAQQYQPGFLQRSNSYPKSPLTKATSKPEFFRFVGQATSTNPPAVAPPAPQATPAPKDKAETAKEGPHTLQKALLGMGFPEKDIQSFLNSKRLALDEPFSEVHLDDFLVFDSDNSNPPQMDVPFKKTSADKDPLPKEGDTIPNLANLPQTQSHKAPPLLIRLATNTIKAALEKEFESVEGDSSQSQSLVVTLREFLIKDWNSNPTEVDQVFERAGFNKEMPYSEPNLGLYLDRQMNGGGVKGDEFSFGDFDNNEDGQHLNDKEVDEKDKVKVPMASDQGDPMNEKPSRSKETSFAPKKAETLVKSEPLHKSSNPLSTSQHHVIDISDSPSDFSEADVISLSNTPEVKQKRPRGRPRGFSRANSDEDFVLPKAISTINPPQAKTSPEYLSQALKEVEDEFKPKPKPKSKLVSPNPMPKAPPSVPPPPKPLRIDSDSSSDPPPLKPPTKPLSKASPAPAPKAVATQGTQPHPLPVLMTTQVALPKTPLPPPPVPKALPLPVPEAPLPPAIPPIPLSNIIPETVSVPLPSPQLLPKTEILPASTPSAPTILPVPVTTASTSAAAPVYASPEPIRKPQSLSMSESPQRNSKSLSAEGSKRDNFERAMRIQQKRRESASNENPDLDLSSNFSDEDNDAHAEAKSPNRKRALKSDNESSSDVSSFDVDLDNDLDSLIAQAPKSPTLTKVKSKTEIELEKAVEMERLLKEKQAEGEKELERNTLEVSQGIFRTKTEPSTDPKVEPKAEAPNLNSNTNPSPDPDSLFRAFMKRGKTQSSFVSDLRTKCPNLTMVRADKPRISAAAKKFLPIGNETRAIPSQSTVCFTEAKQFFQLPKEKLDAIARKLVIKVREDFLVGNHGVFVAENEVIEEDTFIEYVGIIRTEEETEERFKHLEDVSQYPDRFYHWDVPVSEKLKFVVCGFGCGNPTILFNDPTPPPSTEEGGSIQSRRKRNQEPAANMKAMFFLYEGVPRVLYRATRKIEAGEELLVNYYNPDNSTSTTIQNMNDVVEKDFMLRLFLHKFDPVNNPDPRKPVYVRDEFKEPTTTPAPIDPLERGGRELRVPVSKTEGPGYEVVPAWSAAEPEEKSRYAKRRAREESDEKKSHRSDDSSDDDIPVKSEGPKWGSTEEPPKKIRRVDAPSNMSTSANPSDQSDKIACRKCDYSNSDISNLFYHYRLRHGLLHGSLETYPELFNSQVHCPVPGCPLITTCSRLLRLHLRNTHNCSDPREVYPFAFEFKRGSNTESVMAHRAKSQPGTRSELAPNSEDSSSTRRSLKRSRSEGSPPSSTDAVAPPKKKARSKEVEDEEEDYIGLPDDGNRYKLVSPSKDLLLETKSEKDGQWYSSKIQSIDDEEGLVTIRFDGFPRSCDEKFDITSTTNFRPHFGQASFDRVATHPEFSQVHSFPKKADGSYKGTRAQFVRL